ncbi:sterol desaturase family protein [Marilutibacter alkalisoli]|uniref:Sterol desaturase family protein n=1 Tax=Marilutibacter alkalisoli TaxID=2591633 RepID=A0A514BPZ5_9GAMM|nr:sterol desaturase family protein [Lysobacter alkalisoli]QDH69446.1 sterol desaturase family protein [Lysobacter alkalisoli]
MGEWFIAQNALTVMAVGVAFFTLLYAGTGLLSVLLSRVVLPHIGHGRRLDPRPVTGEQLRRELRASASSILIFGIGLVVPWGLLRLGWAGLAVDPPWWQVAIEIGVLFLWNELHFYLNHRLLHTRPMRRFHAMHHRSHVPTPWSTYAFHPVEAAMLGSVPLIPMLLHDFSFAALMTLPVLSIALNNLGHSNYEASRDAPARGWLGASRRHHLHHACYHGNYGFLLEVFDRMFGSVIPLDAADRNIARHTGHGTTEVSR